jgi:nicotinamide riboside transporter PnuC
MSHAAWWWSWLLMFVGVTGLYFSGKQKWWGWLIGLLSEILWMIYAIVTEQYGFIIFALVYAIVFTKNAYSWYNNSP